MSRRRPHSSDPSRTGGPPTAVRLPDGTRIPDPCVDSRRRALHRATRRLPMLGRLCQAAYDPATQSIDGAWWLITYPQPPSSNLWAPASVAYAHSCLRAVFGELAALSGVDVPYVANLELNAAGVLHSHVQVPGRFLGLIEQFMPRGGRRLPDGRPVQLGYVERLVGSALWTRWVYCQKCPDSTGLSRYAPRSPAGRQIIVQRYQEAREICAQAGRRRLPTRFAAGGLDDPQLPPHLLPLLRRFIRGQLPPVTGRYDTLVDHLTAAWRHEQRDWWRQVLAWRRQPRWPFNTLEENPESRTAAGRPDSFALHCAGGLRRSGVWPHMTPPDCVQRHLNVESMSCRPSGGWRARGGRVRARAPPGSHSRGATCKGPGSACVETGRCVLSMRPPDRTLMSHSGDVVLG